VDVAAGGQAGRALGREGSTSSPASPCPRLLLGSEHQPFSRASLKVRCAFIPNFLQTWRDLGIPNCMEKAEERGQS